MKRTIGILIRMIHIIVLTVMAICMVGYFAIHFRLTDYVVKHSITHTLAEQLNTSITVDNLEINWLNQVALNGFVLYDQHNDTLLYARRMMVAYELMPILRQKLILNNIQLVDFDIRTKCAEAGTAPNYQFLIDAFAPRQSNRQRKIIHDFQANAIFLRGGKFSYHIANKEPVYSQIDPNHIEIKDISGHMGFTIRQDDGVRLQLKRLTMKEKCGLNLNKCHMNVHVSSTKTTLNDITLELDNSKLSANSIQFVNHPIATLLTPCTDDDNAQFVVSTDALMLSVSPKDLNRMLPLDTDSQTPVTYTGDIYGTNRQIQIPSLLITGRQHLRIAAEFSASEFSHPDSLRYDINVLSSFVSDETTQAILKQLKLDNTERYMHLADSIGLIRFEGRAQGMLSHADIDLNIESEAGMLSADGLITTQDSGRHIAFDGQVHTQALDMGKILENHKDFGKLTSASTLHIVHRPDHPLQVQTRTRCALFEFRQYAYHDIRIDGTISPYGYNGFISVVDSLCHIEAKGDVRWNAPYTARFEAKIGDCHPYLQGLCQYQNIDSLHFSANVSSDIVIQQNLLSNGHFLIDSIRLMRASDTLEVTPISLITSGGNQKHEVLLSSPIIEVSYEGNQPPGMTRESVQQMLGNYLTDFAPRHIDTTQQTTFTIMGKVPANIPIANMLHLPGYVGKDISFDAYLNQEENRLYGEILIPQAEYNDIALQNVNVFTENTDEDTQRPSLAIHATGKISENQKNRVCTIDLDAICMDDTISQKLELDYQTPKNHIATNLTAKGSISPLLVEISPTNIIINNQDFHLNRTTFQQIDDHTYSIADLCLEHEEQKLTANGLFSSRSGGNLSVNLDHFALDYIFELFGKNYLAFGGKATGDLQISNDSVPHLQTTNLLINDFSYQDTILGTADFSALFDFEKSKLQLNTDVKTIHDNHTHINGNVILGKGDSIDILFRSRYLPIGFLNYWLDGVVQNLSGRATGDIRLYGTSNELNITGSPMIHDARFSTSLLGATFFFNDTIYLETDTSGQNGKIRFDHIALKDKLGNTCIFHADIRHKHLKNFEYDVNINIPEETQGFLVFDFPQQPPGGIYWGQLFTTGYCNIVGRGNRHIFDVDMQTAGNSNFYLSPEEQNYTSNNYNFLTFRDKNTVFENSAIGIQDNTPTTLFKKSQKTRSHIEANLLISATDRCQVYVQMDPLAEDRLICKGFGDLNLHYDANNDITLAGEYNITGGSYTITMRGDLINKEFNIQNGSSVKFTGNPAEAELNLNAVYNIPSVNLRDLDESFASMASISRTTLPVDCKLNVTGQLNAPQVAFDLEVKNVSDDVQALVHNIIGTPEMLNREVFYLLLFNKFYTPEYASTSQSNSASELSSFASASLTSQLNSLLGHMSDNFSVGTNFRTDKGDFSDMEMDLSLSTSLLNDRLILNGNLGYRDPANRIGVNNSSTSFIGDFDVEYLINPKGTLRAKAYSHHNERDYSINNALTTQGIGLIIRRDFQSFRELFMWSNYFKGIFNKSETNSTSE